MTNLNDDLLFGAESTRTRDTDGDGVSDAQESLDGTDPNDADSNIRRDQPERDPLELNDPRFGIDEINLERETIVDVLGSVPAGKSLDQTLGTGLDGKPIGKSPNDLGYSDADKLLEGRGTDANSPLNMDRDPLAGNTPAKPVEGRDATIDTLGREAGPGAGGVQEKVGGSQSTPPPDADLSFRAPHNDLVSGTDGGTPAPKPDPHAPPKTDEQLVKDRDSNKDNRDFDKWKKDQAGKMTDPNADSGGVVTEDQIERAIVLQGTHTDFVPGAGTHIDDSAPPKRPGDLVTDPGDEDPGAGDTGTVTPPGGEISKPVNPLDNLPGGGLSPGLGNGSGGTGGGDGGDNTGRDGFSSAATATTNTGAPGSGSGVVNIGAGSTGGIQSVSGQDSEATDSSGRASQSYAMMAGDDDDLEELEVQRADMAAAGPGTQTEDEIYIGVTSAPVDPPGGDDPSSANVAQLPVATVAGVISPILELEVDVIGVGLITGTALNVDTSPPPASSLDGSPDAVATIPIGGAIIGQQAEVREEFAIATPLDPIDDSFVEVEIAIDDPIDETFAQRSSDNDDLALPEGNLDEGF